MEAERYAWLCSKLTLQSEKRGFFQTLADTASDVASEDNSGWLESWNNIKNDVERLHHCYTKGKVGEYVRETLSVVQEMYRTKSDRLCEESAEAAEAALKEKKTMVALQLANQAVARASSSEIVSGSGINYLVWTLRIRCKVMEANCLWDMALADLQYLIKQNPPANIKEESYLKMATCYLSKGEAGKAKIALDICQKLACGNKDLIDKCDSLRQKISLLKIDVKEKVDKKDNTVPDETRLNGFSHGIEMVQTNDAGRCMVAKRDISVGNIVACESPYAAVLLPDCHGTHCQHCFTRLKIFVPCTICSGVAYCSAMCMNQAIPYHRYECKFIQLMIGSGMSVLCFLAYRIISQQSVDYFLQIKNELGDVNSKHPYVKVYQLESHCNQRDSQSFMHRSLMALFLLTILKKSGYFPNQQDEFTDDELFIGSILLRNLQVLQYNAHEIYDSLYKSKKEMKRSKTKYIGVAVYPKVAMLNHDCQPTLARHFIGKYISLRCTRPLKAGDNVTENYGPVFTMKSLEDRQRSLMARYLFKCSCLACRENWPLLDNLKDTDLHVICSNKDCKKKIVKYTLSSKKKQMSVKCACGESISERALLYKSHWIDFYRGIDLMERGQVEEAIIVLSKFLEIAFTLVSQPDRILSLAQEALRNCWASQHNAYFVE